MSVGIYLLVLMIFSTLMYCTKRHFSGVWNLLRAVYHGLEIDTQYLGTMNVVNLVTLVPAVLNRGWM